MSEQCSVMTFSRMGTRSFVASVLSRSLGMVMGGANVAAHFPGAVVLSVRGMMGQSYFCANIVGRGVMDVSCPKRGSWMPAFPECWSASMARMLPSLMNLLAWMRPRLRAKSLEPSFSRLLVM